ncbi:MAG: hypothetical protein V4618_15590 [Pseudomonadota bacterium]
MTVRFPVFEAIKVEGYDLYPGRSGVGGLDVAFADDENLILGVNGLGKSTLLLLLKHMIGGSLKSRPPGFVGENQKNDYVIVDGTMFSVRAKNAAGAATARLTLRFGDQRIQIQRNMRDLSLIAHSIGSAAGVLQPRDRTDYQTDITRLANVHSFADVLRLCDRVVFFLENRERLLWDWRAQYEILRSLLLSPEKAAELRRLESKIISSDSAARNLRAAMHRLTTRHNKESNKIAKSANVLADLAQVEQQLAAAQVEEQRLVDDVDTRKITVIDERARSWKAASEVDETAAQYDQLKYAAIRQEMGSVSLSEQYVLLKLLNEGDCMVCGATCLDDLSQELKQRQIAQLCIMCGSQRVRDSNVTTTSGALAEQAKVTFKLLEEKRSNARDALTRFEQRQQELDAAQLELRASRREVDRLQTRRRGLRQQLPSQDRAQLARTESELDQLESNVSRFERERDDAEAQVEELLAELRQGVEQIRLRLETIFHDRGKDFFIERISLVYEPRLERISQAGLKFEFPAFEVDLTSGATGEAFVRRSYEQASLSQREYLDIAFRMAMMECFGGDDSALVIDGPEGSVDVVFAERAGKMLANYADPSRPTADGAKAIRQILVACNVVEGGFIPNFFGDHPSRADREQRTINLLEIATPTAALEALRPEYASKVSAVLFAGAT